MTHPVRQVQQALQNSGWSVIGVEAEKRFDFAYASGVRVSTLLSQILPQGFQGSPRNSAGRQSREHGLDEIVYRLDESFGRDGLVEMF